MDIVSNDRVSIAQQKSDKEHSLLLINIKYGEIDNRVLVIGDKTYDVTIDKEKYVVEKTVGRTVEHSKISYSVPWYVYLSENDHSEPENYAEPFYKKILRAISTS